MIHHIKHFVLIALISTIIYRSESLRNVQKNTCSNGHDGTPCQLEGKELCWKGRCSRASQFCRQAFGKRASLCPSQDIWKINMEGSLRGNCGKLELNGVLEAVPCALADVNCGQVWCEWTPRADLNETYDWLQSRLERYVPSKSPLTPLNFTLYSIIENGPNLLTCHTIGFNDTEKWLLSIAPTAAVCGHGGWCHNQICITNKCANCPNGQVCQDNGLCGIRTTPQPMMDFAMNRSSNSSTTQDITMNTSKGFDNMTITVTAAMVSEAGLPKSQIYLIMGVVIGVVTILLIATTVIICIMCRRRNRNRRKA
jgi:hypothetical protein